MPRQRHAAPPPAPTAPPEAADATEGQAADTPTLHNKWDPSEVKRVLDDVASQTLLDAGYEEDMFISNTKIFLGLSTCASALLAQFYPLPFPQNYVLLVACIVVYFVLNTALQVFSYVCEKDIILSTHPKEGTSTSGFALSSVLAKHSDEYTLTLRPSRKEAPGACKPAELRNSVAAWFYEDGELAHDLFKGDVLRLLATFERSRPKRA